MIKIIVNEDMENPIIPEVQKADDGTFTINHEEMTQNQWYQFTNYVGQKFYMKINNVLQLVITRNKPTD